MIFLDLSKNTYIAINFRKEEKEKIDNEEHAEHNKEGE